MCFLFLSSTDNNVQIIDEEMQSQEQMKMRRLTLKSQADDLEAEMNDIRKRLTTQQKESNGIQKALTALEIKLEQKRADRHSLLKSCKVSAFGSMIW